MIKKFLANPYLLFLLRIFLGFIFIYSGFIKIIDAQSFSNSILNYKLLPEFLINFLAIILPWVELITGLLLLFGIAVKENAFIINLLLAVFIIAITINIIRGLDINCGCFGTKSGTKIGAAKLLENGFLFLIGILLMIYDSKIFILHSDKTQ